MIEASNIFILLSCLEFHVLWNLSFYFRIIHNEEESKVTISSLKEDHDLRAKQKLGPIGG